MLGSGQLHVSIFFTLEILFQENLVAFNKIVYHEKYPDISLVDLKT